MTKSKMNDVRLPEFGEIVEEFIEILKKRESATLELIYENLIDKFNLRDAFRSPKNSELKDLFEARLSIAKKALIRTNAIEIRSGTGDKPFQTNPKWINFMTNTKNNQAVSRKNREEDTPPDISQKIDKTLHKINMLDEISMAKNITKLFEKMGYGNRIKTGKCPTLRADGGIDIRLIRQQDIFKLHPTYIQIKQRSSGQIGPALLREFAGALQENRAECGVFITNTVFSTGAKEFAENVGITLINGHELARLFIEFAIFSSEEK